jgi:hypothetical protein
MRAPSASRLGRTWPSCLRAPTRTMQDFTTAPEPTCWRNMGSHLVMPHPTRCALLGANALECSAGVVGHTGGGGCSHPAG